MKCLLPFLFVLFSLQVVAQSTDVVSGPMLGYIEHRTANIWIELKEGISESTVVYWDMKKAETTAKRLINKKADASFPNIFKWQLPQLEPGSTYVYNIITGKESKVIGSGELTTQTLWQYRMPAPDFSFLAGSCAYFNEPLYDRPGKPYGGDSSIFQTMANEKNASFMLWLGDNWYTREVDYYSEWGLNYRPSRDRSMPVLQPLLKAMPHYATWDDHDYGPNNADKSYVLKEASRKTFMNFWANPSYGLNGQGIFSRFIYNDVEVFLLDDRWYRSNEDLKDSINGQSTGKQMFGKEQMEWLKNALLHSAYNRSINFRIIATGSQVLNRFSTKDCFFTYKEEFNELMTFLDHHRVNGVVFLTGDRHLASVVKHDRANNYPLYDVTASSLTAGTSRRTEGENNDPNFVVRVDDANNYSRISFTGKGADRTMQVAFLNKNGEQLAEWKITAKELAAAGNK